jgi:hypothetical protein
MFIVLEMYLREMTPLSTPARPLGGVASDTGTGPLGGERQ